MAVQLNHTIVKVTDKRTSAEFFASVLRLLRRLTRPGDLGAESPESETVRAQMAR